MSIEEIEGEVDVAYRCAMSPEDFRAKILPSSPFFIHSQLPLDDGYLLQHREFSMAQPMTSGPFSPSPEEFRAALEENPALREAVIFLGIVPTYTISQEWDYTSGSSLEVCRHMRTILENAHVPYFLIVEGETLDPFVASGHNPVNGRRMQNQRPDFFPL